MTDFISQKLLLLLFQVLHLFLSDPGVPGVRSMDPDVTDYKRFCRINWCDSAQHQVMMFLAKLQSVMIITHFCHPHYSHFSSQLETQFSPRIWSDCNQRSICTSGNMSGVNTQKKLIGLLDRWSLFLSTQKPWLYQSQLGTSALLGLAFRGCFVTNQWCESKLDKVESAKLWDYLWKYFQLAEQSILDFPNFRQKLKNVYKKKFCRYFGTL